MLHRCLRAAAPFAFALAAATTASAAAFPPITDQERALTAMPDQPAAPAVVLFRNGELRMMDPSRQEVSSQLVVRVRLKILTEAGKERGNVQIAHSGAVRLQDFEGRTVLPDGTVVPVPRDATFRRTTSRARRFYVTSVAFPSVQVGAILDYQYSVRWDSMFFLDPWFFQDRVPVLHSEIAYEIPRNLQVSVWRSDPSLQRRQAAAIYDYVRDEIVTEDANRVWLPQYSTAGAVLDRRRGEPAEKAVLLQAMLAAVRIDSRLVWAADRENGAIDMRVANPAWFDRVLVAAQVDGQRVFLDPADRALGFGRLEPGYEGTRALVFDGKKPESIVLPDPPFAENLRRSRLELTLDSGGRATGAGTLTLLGQSAWRRSRWTGDAATAAEAWERWLREQFQGFDVGGVTVAEALDEARVQVAWTLSQHPEEALGDQATLVASRPLGPVRQLFPPGAKRLSAVAFDFGERSEVDLVLHWAAGWQPEVLPRAWKHDSAAGAVETSIAVDGAGRTLVYRRRFDNAHRQAATAEQFRLVQELFEEVQKNDAQPLVLSRR
jgi:Domain of Unknown Function with PDB structure (DUF3857)/Transglutaminase-like superfamily